MDWLADLEVEARVGIGLALRIEGSQAIHSAGRLRLMRRTTSDLEEQLEQKAISGSTRVGCRHAFSARHRLVANEPNDTNDRHRHD